MISVLVTTDGNDKDFILGIFCILSSGDVPSAQTLLGNII